MSKRFHNIENKCRVRDSNPRTRRSWFTVSRNCRYANPTYSKTIFIYQTTTTTSWTSYQTFPTCQIQSRYLRDKSSTFINTIILTYSTVICQIFFKNFTWCLSYWDESQLSESNRWPSNYELDALPTELNWQSLNCDGFRIPHAPLKGGSFTFKLHS